MSFLSVAPRFKYFLKKKKKKFISYTHPMNQRTHPPQLKLTRRCVSQVRTYSQVFSITFLIH